MTIPERLQTHLDGGHTTLSRCWKLTRRDGRVFGFTDHDRDLAFAGVTFRAGTGLGARALAQGTGLSVDNGEALGALSDAAVSEEDIAAGRFDGAEVEAWLVNWARPGERVKLFRGSLGEITRADGQFSAELRGLTEALNQPQGRVYQRPCSAVLGDAQCRFALDTPGYRAEASVRSAEAGRVFRLPGLAGFAEGWFERGRLTVLSGAGEGLSGVVKADRLEEEEDGLRVVELWEAIRAEIREGDMLRVEAGCDKRAETCREKFGNFINFRGFPHIPGEDWLMSYPAGDGTGGSLFE